MPANSTPTNTKSPGLLSRMGMTAKKWVSSFVVPAQEIHQNDTTLFGAGSTTVASLLASGNREARSRQAIYNKWSQMEGDAVVSTAIGLLVTSALGGHETSGQLIFIEKTPEAESDKRLGELVDEMSVSLSGLFNRVAHQVAYTGSAFGDAYARIYSDERGVYDLYTDELVRPQLVQPFERGSRTVGFAVYTGKKHFERLDSSQMARMKMPRTVWVPQHGIYEKSMRLAITEDVVDNLPILPSMAGGSLLYNAEESYDNFSASVMGLVGQRWIDSIDEQTVGVNLESMTREQQEQFLGSVKTMLTSSKQYAERAYKTGKPIMERIRHILPVFGEKQLITLGSAAQPGRASNLTIEDVMLHARLLSGALGVDLSMLGFADQMSGGLGEGGFFRVSAQAAERARVIRVALSEFFDSIIDIHTLKRYGVVFEAGNRPWKINFFGSISALESERQRTRMDAMNSGLMLLQAMQLVKDLGASREVMVEFLTKTMLLDDDQAKTYATVVDSAGSADGGGMGYEQDLEPEPEPSVGRPAFGGRGKSRMNSPDDEEVGDGSDGGGESAGADGGGE